MEGKEPKNIIITEDDLAEYENELNSAKFSLLILFLPVFRDGLHHREIDFKCQGEIKSLYTYLVVSNSKAIGTTKIICEMLLDNIIQEKLRNMRKLILQDYYLIVNELGGYTPIRKEL